MRTVFQDACCSQCQSLFPWRILQMSQCCVKWLNANFSGQTYFSLLPSLPSSICLISLSIALISLFPTIFLPISFFFFLPNNKYHKALSCPVHHARFRVNKHECLMVPVLNGLIPWAARQTIKQGGRRDIIRVKFLKIYSRGKWHFRERQEMG